MNTNSPLNYFFVESRWLCVSPWSKVAEKFCEFSHPPKQKPWDPRDPCEAQKHVTPYVAFDSEGEHEFAQALENAEEVQVYAKLPRKLQIPTPVGNYVPDWAIVLTEGSVKHIFFVAETKGSLDGMELRGVEKVKTECAKNLFNKLSTSK